MATKKNCWLLEILPDISSRDHHPPARRAARNETIKMASQQDQWVSDSEASGSDPSSSDIEHDEVLPNKNSNAAMYEKDSDEEDLERLVLGNKATFRENLFKGDWLDGQGLDENGDELPLADEDTAGLEDIDDADLFMLDTGTAGVGNRIAIPAAQTPGEAEAPAWRIATTSDWLFPLPTPPGYESSG